MRDMSPLKIRMLVHDAGFDSFKDLDDAFDLPKNTTSNAARFPKKDGEEVLIKVLKIKPYKIWPSRYYLNGNRRSRFPLSQYTGPKVRSHCQKDAA